MLYLCFIIYCLKNHMFLYHHDFSWFFFLFLKIKDSKNFLFSLFLYNYQFNITPIHCISAKLLAIASQVLAFSSSVVVGWQQYTLLLRWPHDKKSNPDKSEDLESHGMSLFIMSLCDYQTIGVQQTSITCSKRLEIPNFIFKTPKSTK